MREASSHLAVLSFSCSIAARMKRAGTSSSPISNKISLDKVSTFFLQQREAKLLAFLKICCRYGAGKIADSCYKACTFSHADGSARIQKIEGVGAFQHIIV